MVEAKDDFYELQATVEQMPIVTNVKIVMGDLNAKVEMDNKGREEVMGRHGVRAEMNGNGVKWTDFCQVNELVIGGMLFPHRECHKQTWMSPNGVTENQINHMGFSERWRNLLREVRVKHEADIGSGHYLQAKVRLRIDRVYCEVIKLRDPQIRVM